MRSLKFLKLPPQIQYHRPHTLYSRLLHLQNLYRKILYQIESMPRVRKFFRKKGEDKKYLRQYVQSSETSGITMNQGPTILCICVYRMYHMQQNTRKWVISVIYLYFGSRSKSQIQKGRNFIQLDAGCCWSLRWRWRIVEV